MHFLTRQPLAIHLAHAAAALRLLVSERLFELKNFRAVFAVGVGGQELVWPLGDDFVVGARQQKIFGGQDFFHGLGGVIFGGFFDQRSDLGTRHDLIVRDFSHDNSFDGHAAGVFGDDGAIDRLTILELDRIGRCME